MFAPRARATAGSRSLRFRSRASAFRPDAERLGIQYRAHDFAQARGRSVVRRAARHAISSGIRGGRNHEPRRAHAGHRAGSAPVPRRHAGCIWGTGDDDFTGKPGLDVFYSLTPSLRLTATFNTDFGETEVDARQINLSRFSLLFPEKRAFFLEGAGVFSFASTGPETPGGIPGTGADLYPFFSRQIGLIGGQRGSSRRGLKLTGTVGRTEIGVLSVRTRRSARGGRALADDEGFFIGRVKRNLFEQSYVGAIFTERQSLAGIVGANLWRRRAPGDIAVPRTPAQLRRRWICRERRQRSAARVDR